MNESKPNIAVPGPTPDDVFGVVMEVSLPDGSISICRFNLLNRTINFSCPICAFTGESEDNSINIMSMSDHMARHYMENFRTVARGQVKAAPTVNTTLANMVPTNTTLANMTPTVNTSAPRLVHAELPRNGNAESRREYAERFVEDALRSKSEPTIPPERPVVNLHHHVHNGNVPPAVFARDDGLVVRGRGYFGNDERGERGYFRNSERGYERDDYPDRDVDEYRGRPVRRAPERMPEYDEFVRRRNEYDEDSEYAGNTYYGHRGMQRERINVGLHRGRGVHWDHNRYEDDEYDNGQFRFVNLGPEKDPTTGLTEDEMLQVAMAESHAEAAQLGIVTAAPAVNPDIKPALAPSGFSAPFVFDPMLVKSATITECKSGIVNVDITKDTKDTKDTEHTEHTTIVSSVPSESVGTTVLDIKSVKPQVEFSPAAVIVYPQRKLKKNEANATVFAENEFD